MVDLQLQLEQSEMYKPASQHPAQSPQNLCAGAAAGATVCTEVSHIVAFLQWPGQVVAIHCKHHRLSTGSAAAELRPM